MKNLSPYVDLRFSKALNERSNYWAMFQYFDESYVDMPDQNAMLTIKDFTYSGLSQPSLCSHQSFSKACVNLNIYTNILDYKNTQNDCFFEIRNYLKIIQLEIFWKVNFHYLVSIQNALAHCNKAFLRIQLSGEYREDFFNNFKVEKNVGLEIPISSIELSFEEADK